MRITIIVFAVLTFLTSRANDNLKAFFTADKQQGVLPLSVSFKGMGDKPGVSYFWDFGNGNTSMRKETSAMFVNPGNYRVKLIVSDGTQSDSTIMNIQVLPNPDIIRAIRGDSPAE